MFVALIDPTASVTGVMSGLTQTPNRVSAMTWNWSLILHGGCFHTWFICKYIQFIIYTQCILVKDL